MRRADVRNGTTVLRPIVHDTNEPPSRAQDVPPLGCGHTLGTARQRIGAVYDGLQKTSFRCGRSRVIREPRPTKDGAALAIADHYFLFDLAAVRPLGRVYLMGRLLGSIFVTPVPFLSSRI